MDISTQRSGDEVTVKITGSLNTNTAPELEKVMEETFSDPDAPSSVIFDFSDLDYISSAGLRVVMVVFKRTAAMGGSLTIEGSSDEVMEVFEITGIADLLGL